MLKVPYLNLSKTMTKLAIDADTHCLVKLNELDEKISKRGMTQLKNKDGEVVQAVFVEQSELNYLRDLYDSPI